MLPSVHHDNFDHNEDTTTSTCTHVMSLISSQYPKSNTLSTQPIMKQTVTFVKMIDLANVRGLVKMYEKPSISKFKKTFAKACDPSQLDRSLYDILGLVWLLSISFMDKPPNWQGFMQTKFTELHYHRRYNSILLLHLIRHHMKQCSAQYPS